MKRSQYSFFVAALFLGAVVHHAFGGPESSLLTVAVAEFQTRGIAADQTWLGKSFADALITRLSKARTVRVVEREFLEQILNELRLQSSALVDEKSAVQLGRLLGARIFVFGTVSSVDGEVVVRARIVSVERGEVLGVAEATGRRGDILGIQREIGLQVSSSLALDAALSNTFTPEVTEISIATLNDLDRLRLLCSGLPVFGLDPGRARRRADYQSALLICDKAIELYPRLGAAHYYRALFTFQMEDLERALAESQVAQSLTPDDPDNLLLESAILHAMKKKAEGIGVLREATMRTPQDARLWYALGKILGANGQEAEAVTAYLKALEHTPALLEAETNLRALLGGPQGLVLLTEVDSQWPLYSNAARCFRMYWKNEIKDVSETARMAVSSFPDLYIGYYMLGIAEKQDDHTDSSLSSFEHCLALRPTFAEVHKEIGLVYLRNVQCAEGERHIKVYLRMAAHIDDFAELERKIQQCYGQ